MAEHRGGGDAAKLGQPTKAKGGGRPRSEANRRMILAAAIELLEHETVQSITSEAIANRAGVSKATIYRWWPSKVSVVIDAFIEHQILHTPMDTEIHPAEALLKHWRMMASQYSGKAGRIASQIIAVGQSDPDIMSEFLRKFLSDRATMSQGVVESLIQLYPNMQKTFTPEMFMELFYSPIHTRLLLRHLPIDEDFIRNFPLNFFHILGIEFDEGGRLRTDGAATPSA